MATMISFDEYLDGCSDVAMAYIKSLSERDSNLHFAIEVATKQTLSEMEKEDREELMRQYVERLTH